MTIEQDNRIVWHNNTFKKTIDATTNILTHSLHYGSAVFEGIRVYETDKGPAIFRFDDHLQRFFYSAGVMGMQMPYSTEDIHAATIELIKRNNYASCYLRHIAYYGYGNLRVMPAADMPIDVAIACWPWGTYLSDDPIDINISSYIRIHPRSTVTDAKIAGHYVNCILSGLRIKGTHYKESLFLDADDNVSEVGSANFFLVKNNKLYTPPRDTILPGITRNTIMELARYLGYEVFEQHITVEDIYAADEAFLTGTAAEVTVVATLDDKRIGCENSYPVALELRRAYMALVHGEIPQFLPYLTFVNESADDAT